MEPRLIIDMAVASRRSYSTEDVMLAQACIESVENDIREIFESNSDYAESIIEKVREWAINFVAMVGSDSNVNLPIVHAHALRYILGNEQ